MQTIKNPKNSNPKNFLIWLAIFAAIFIISDLIGGPDGLAGKKFTFSEFMQKVDAGEVKKVDIKGDDLVGFLKDDAQFYVYLPQRVCRELDDASASPGTAKSGSRSEFMEPGRRRGWAISIGSQLFPKRWPSNTKGERKP